jgi:hypothetical protein
MTLCFPKQDGRNVFLFLYRKSIEHERASDGTSQRIYLAKQQLAEMALPQELAVHSAFLKPAGSYVYWQTCRPPFRVVCLGPLGRANVRAVRLLSLSLYRTCTELHGGTPVFSAEIRVWRIGIAKILSDRNTVLTRMFRSLRRGQIVWLARPVNERSARPKTCA